MLYISFHYRYKKQIIIISIILILLSISGYFIYINIPKKEEIKISKEEPIKNTKPEKVEEKKYKVDIKGQINNPGIYEVVISSRVIDQTTPNMIQGLKGIFARKPLISKGI